MAAKVKVTAPAARSCMYGQSAYGSAATDPRCGLPIEGLAEHPSRQLCTSCNALWKVEQKRRVSAKAAPAVTALQSVESAPIPKRKSTPKERATGAPVRRVISEQPAMTMLVALDPTEGQDAK